LVVLRVGWCVLVAGLAPQPPTPHPPIPNPQLLFFIKIIFIKNNRLKFL